LHPSSGISFFFFFICDFFGLLNPVLCSPSLSSSQIVICPRVLSCFPPGFINPCPLLPRKKQKTRGKSSLMANFALHFCGFSSWLRSPHFPLTKLRSPPTQALLSDPLPSLFSRRSPSSAAVGRDLSFFFLPDLHGVCLTPDLTPTVKAFFT